MIVGGKLITYDLSRFSKCALKRAAICDLMQIPEFVAALNSEKEFDISDEWIAKIAKDLESSLRMSEEEKRLMSDDDIKLRKSMQAEATNVVRLYKKMGLL